MRYLVFIALFAGVCHGLQAPLRYKYKYLGSVYSGMPELSHDVVGTAIKADVDVFVEKDDGVAILQLHNVMLAEFTEELGCDVRLGLPDTVFHRHEDSGVNEAFESPFRVQLFQTQGELTLEDSQDKYDWLVNVKKSIAALFKNEILRANTNATLEGTVAEALHQGHVYNVFSLQEDTILGRCQVDYTVYPIPEYLAGSRNHEIRGRIEEDFQNPESGSEALKMTSRKTKKYSGRKSRTKTSKTTSKYRKPAPPLKQELWHVIRSVNFDHCEDMVFIQISPVGIRGNLAVSQYEYGRGRSSVSEYIFRGSPGQTRLERVIIEGANLFAPMGFKSELLQMRVNQSLELVSVTSGTPAPTGPFKGKNSNTWLYQIWSFASYPTVSKPYPWVVYDKTELEHYDPLEIFGLEKRSPDQRDEMKKAIIKNVETVSKLHTDLDQESKENYDGEAASLLQQSALLFKYMKSAEISEIIEEFFKKDLMHADDLAKRLIIDTAAASGSYFAYSVILDYIKSDKLSPTQIATFFMFLSSNAECPSSVPMLMNYVTSLDFENHPFMSATVLLNFADYVSHMCLDPLARTTHYGGPLFGDLSCNKKIIKDQFLPYLKNIIYGEKNEWEKSVAITALRILGTPFAFPILTDVITGKVNCSHSMRVSAIYALGPMPNQNHGYLKHQIVDILTDVYSDIAEPAEVRQAAVVTVAFTQPEASFWYRLAATTWREPSINFATYVTSLIESFASSEKFPEQHKAATFALRLAKPVSPSQTVSFILQASQNFVHRHAMTYQVFDLQHMMKSDVTFSLYYLSMTYLGGFSLTDVELYGSFIMKEGNDLLKEYFKEDVPSFSGIPQKIVEDLYNTIEETIKTKNLDPPEVTKIRASLYLKMLDHIHLYFPFTESTLKTFEKEMLLQPLQMATGLDELQTKFFAPIDIKSILPSEIGLPFFITTHSSMIISDMSYTVLSRKDEGASEGAMSQEKLMKASWDGSSTISSLIPWNERISGSMVRGGMQIVLPLQITIRFDSTPPVSSFHVDIQSLYAKKFDLVRNTNTPGTFILSLLPLGKPPIHFKTLTKVDIQRDRIPLPQNFTGLDLSINWISETPFFLPLLESLDIFSNPESLAEISTLSFYTGSDTTKFWMGSLEFNPQTSTTKNVSFEFMIGAFGKQEDEASQFTQESGQFAQYDQDGQGQYEQDAFDIEQGFEDVSGWSEGDTSKIIDIKDSKMQRSEKLQKEFGSSVTILDFKAHFEGDVHLAYEMAFIWTRPKRREERKMRQFQLAFLRSSIPGIDDESASICLEIHHFSPILSQLDTVDSLLSRNLDKEIRAEVKLGCKKESDFVVKASYQLTDIGKSRLRELMNKHCDHDSQNPLLNFHLVALYDDITYKILPKEISDHPNDPVTTQSMNRSWKWLSAPTSHDSSALLKSATEAELHIHRCPKSDSWIIDWKRKEEKINLLTVPHSEAFDLVFGIGENILQKEVLLSGLSEQCVVGVNSVRTFDGFSYDYEPTSCWTVATRDCHSMGSMLLIRSPSTESSIPEAKYIDPTRGLAIEYSRHRLMVNGRELVVSGNQEIIRNDDGKKVCVIFKKDDYHMIRFSDEFFITIKEKVRIHLPITYKSQMCGLCGNYDSEPEAELFGPQRCYYEDPSLFAKSWTAGGDTCNPYQLLTLREEVEKYQETCSALKPPGTKCVHFNDRCFKFGWFVRVIDQQLCISSSSLGYCNDDCDMQESRSLVVKFDCWPADHAPEPITKALADDVKYITSPISQEPHSHGKAYLPVATSCKKP